MASIDYYEVLGISKDASQADIKKAFRKKAREFHPDVNKEEGAEAQFKQVNEAYDVLSDEKKRQQYDTYGTVGDMGGYGNVNVDDIFGGMGMDDIFSSFFGGGGGRSRSRAVRTEGRDMGIAIEVTLAEVAAGVTREVAYDRLAPCDVCHGSGLGEHGEVVTCDTCGGSGAVVTTQQTFLGAMQSREICPDCNGTGKKIVDPCTECEGTGRVPDRERVKVEIPAGIRDSQQLRVSNRGEAGLRGAQAGDLIVEVIVAPDVTFKRNGDELQTRCDVSVAQAALGATIKINGILKDEIVEVEVPAGVQNDQVVRISGMGMPRFRRKGRGDLKVQINVDVPKTLTDEQRELFEKLAETFDEDIAPKTTAWQKIHDFFN